MGVIVELRHYLYYANRESHLSLHTKSFTYAPFLRLLIVL